MEKGPAQAHSQGETGLLTHRPALPVPPTLLLQQIPTVHSAEVGGWEELAAVIFLDAPVSK